MAKNSITDSPLGWGNSIEKESPAPGNSPLDFQEPYNTDLSLPDIDRTEKELFRVKEYGLPMAGAWDIPTQDIPYLIKARAKELGKHSYLYGYELLSAKLGDRGEVVYAFWCDTPEEAEAEYLQYAVPEFIEGLKKCYNKNTNVMEPSDVDDYFFERLNTTIPSSFGYMEDEYCSIVSPKKSWDIPEPEFEVGDTVRFHSKSICPDYFDKACIYLPDHTGIITNIVTLIDIDKTIKYIVWNKDHSHGFTFLKQDLELTEPKQSFETTAAYANANAVYYAKIAAKLANKNIDFDSLKSKAEDDIWEYTLETTSSLISRNNLNLSWDITNVIKEDDNVRIVANIDDLNKINVDPYYLGTIGKVIEILPDEYEYEYDYGGLYKGRIYVHHKGATNVFPYNKWEDFLEVVNDKLSFEAKAANDAMVEKFIKEAQPGQIWYSRSGFALILSPNNSVEYERKNDNKLILKSAVWMKLENKTDVDLEQDFGTTIVDEKYDFPLYRQNYLSDFRTSLAWNIPTNLRVNNFKELVDNLDSFQVWESFYKYKHDNYLCIGKDFEALSIDSSLIRGDTSWSDSPVYPTDGYLIGVPDKCFPLELIKHKTETWDIPNQEPEVGVGDKVRLKINTMHEIGIDDVAEYFDKNEFEVSHIEEEDEEFEDGDYNVPKGLGSWGKGAIYIEGFNIDGNTVSVVIPLQHWQRYLIEIDNKLSWDIPEPDLKLTNEDFKVIDTNLQEIARSNNGNNRVMGMGKESYSIYGEISKEKLLQIATEFTKEDLTGKKSIRYILVERAPYDDEYNIIYDIYSVDEYNDLELVEAGLSLGKSDLSSLSWNIPIQEIKLGSRVKILSKSVCIHKNDTYGVGKFGYVVNEVPVSWTEKWGKPAPAGSRVLRVEVDEGTKASYLESDLEVVDETLSWDIEPQPELKIRDKVKILSKSVGNKKGDYIKELLGKTGIIANIYRNSKECNQFYKNRVSGKMLEEESDCVIYDVSVPDKGEALFLSEDLEVINSNKIASKKDEFKDEIFIYLDLPKSVRKRFNHISNLDQDLHMTLICQKDTKLTPDEKKKVVKAIQKVAKQYKKIKCKFTGLGTFDNGDNTVAALVNCIEGSEVYQKCLEAVESVMGEVDRKFGYLPHVTLKYEGTGKANLKDLKPFSWTAKELCCKFSEDDLYRITLKSGKVEEKVNKLSWDIPMGPSIGDIANNVEEFVSIACGGQVWRDKKSGNFLYIKSFPNIFTICNERFNGNEHAISVKSSGWFPYQDNDCFKIVSTDARQVVKDSNYPMELVQIEDIRKTRFNRLAWDIPFNPFDNIKTPLSDAERANLKAGDIICEFSGNNQILTLDYLLEPYKNSRANHYYIHINKYRTLDNLFRSAVTGEASYFIKDLSFIGHVNDLEGFKQFVIKNLDELKTAFFGDSTLSWDIPEPEPEENWVVKLLKGSTGDLQKELKSLNSVIDVEQCFSVTDLRLREWIEQELQCRENENNPDIIAWDIAEDPSEIITYTVKSCVSTAGDSHRYKNDRGEISLIYPCKVTNNTYEIYGMTFNILEDIERYSTLKEAEDRIKELLQSNNIREASLAWDIPYTITFGDKVNNIEEFKEVFEPNQLWRDNIGDTLILSKNAKIIKYLKQFFINIEGCCWVSNPNEVKDVLNGSIALGSYNIVPACFPMEFVGCIVNKEASLKLAAPESYTDKSDIDMGKDQFDQQALFFRQEDHLDMVKPEDWLPGENDVKYFPSTLIHQRIDAPPQNADVDRVSHLKFSNTGDFYPSSIGYRIEPNNIGNSGVQTALDIVNFEADELGNESTRTNAIQVAKSVGVDLKKLPANDIIWVTKKPEEAFMYGFDEEGNMGSNSNSLTKEQGKYLRKQITKVFIPRGSVILDDLGSDGCLVLLGNYRKTRKADLNDHDKAILNLLKELQDPEKMSFEASEEYDSVLDPQPEEVVRRGPTDQKQQQDPAARKLDKDDADNWFERGLHRIPNNVNDMRPLMPYGSKLSWDIKKEFDPEDFVTTYKFDELPENLQEKVIENLYDINVNYDWWDNIYEDAKQIGLRIIGFDIDRGSYCSGELIQSMTECIRRILQNHGEACDTYRTALDYKRQLSEIESRRTEDNEYEIDNEVEDLESEFVKAICEDYLKMLRGEYEYLTSREAIKETIENNDWDFNNRGRIASNLLSWDIPVESEFEVGDKVRILSKSIKFDLKGTNLDYRIGRIYKIQFKYISKESQFTYWDLKPDPNEFYYVIDGDFYLAQDLELVKKAESSLDNEVENEYIESNNSKDNYGQHNDYSQYSLFNTAENYKEAKDEPTSAQENQQPSGEEVQQDTKKTELNISYPSTEEIIDLHNEILSQYGGKTGIFPEGEAKLEAAIGRMQSGMGETEFYPTLVEKAAVLIHSIITTHPFLDGNKRTAFLSGVKFLHLQGISIEDSDNVAEIIIQIADGKMSYEQLRDWLKDYSSHFMDKHEKALLRLSWDIPFQPEAVLYQFKQREARKYGYVFLVVPAAFNEDKDIYLALWDEDPKIAKDLYEVHVTAEVIDNIEKYIGENPDYEMADLRKMVSNLDEERLGASIGWVGLEDIEKVDENKKLSWNIEPQAMKGMYQFKNRNIEDREYGIPVLICPYNYSDQGDAVWAFWFSSKEAAESIYDNFITPEVIEELETFVRLNPNYEGISICKKLKQLINNDAAFNAFWWMPEESVEECKESIESWDIKPEPELDLEPDLNEIAEEVSQGKLEGRDWSINYNIFEEGFEIDQVSLDYVADLILNGYTSGELHVTNDNNETSQGWWNLSFEIKSSKLTWDIPVDGKDEFSIGDRVRLIRDDYFSIEGTDTFLKWGLEGSISEQCINRYYYRVLWDKYPWLKEGIPTFYDDIELI